MELIEQEDGRRRRRSYDESFKRDAVRLVSEEKYSFKGAAAAVNVCEQSLRAWHAKFAPPEPCGEHASVEELRDEVARLRKQLKRAELEREILKKRRRTSRRSRCEVRLDHAAWRHVSDHAVVRAVGRVEVGVLRLGRPQAEFPRAAA